jgi:predicted Zn-dependent peptidase
MLHEGTSQHSGQEIAEIIALYGAFIETQHSLDFVNVTFYVLEKHVESLFPLIFEILTQSVFPEQELGNLKNITCQNLRVNKEKGQFLSSIEFRKALFGTQHPYGTQYWENDITQISKEEIVDFFHRYFTLSNLEVFFSGSFNEEKMKQLFEKYFQNHPLPLAPDPSNISLLSDHSPILVERKDAMQSSIRVGRLCISRQHPDYPHFAVLNELLGGFFGSRLMKNIREDKGYTYGIHSSIQTLQNATYFVIGTDVKKENAQHTLDEVWKEMDRLKTEQVSEEELGTVKAYMLGKFMNSINTPYALMDKFKNIHFNGLEYPYFDEYLYKVQSISPSKIQQLAQVYFVKDEFCQVVVGGLS